MPVLVLSIAITCATLATPASAQNAIRASSAQISIDGDSFRFVIRLPIDEVDLLLRLDRDLDNQVSGAELDASRDGIGAYVAKHFHVTVDGTPLPVSVDRVGAWRDADAVPYVEIDAIGRSSSRVGAVAIRSDFLTELSPAHKTNGQIRIRGRRGREEGFVFQSGAVYERRLTPDRRTSSVLVLAGLLVVGALWLARRKAVILTVAALVAATPARADVIMSAPGLNATLKTMERLTREIAMARAPSTEREAHHALFQLGVEADSLASLMNQEVESHGMQERELLDLALGRTKELGVTIAYNREKKKFFYDGAAFTEYLKDAPRGAHAAAAEFKLISNQFYQSTGADVSGLTAAAGAKQRFLTRYPTFSENAELRLYLAVDYRDLHRRYRDANDAANAEKYRLLARGECQRILRLYPGSEQVVAARQILQRLVP